MNTNKILGSKTTEKILWILIIGTFILSIILGRIVVDPQREEQTQDVESQLSEDQLENVGLDLTEEQDLNTFEENLLSYPRRTINVDGNELLVAIASTSQQRAQGLSGTNIIPAPLDGLLFAFEELGSHGIWMKDMNYDLDIFWLDGEYNIVHTENNISPETYPESFRSPASALYVLEMVAS